MADLAQLREQIDALDAQIVDLYEKRMGICAQVAEYKIAAGKKVLDKAREQEKLAHLCGMATNAFNRHGIAELFSQIFAMSRKLQYQLMVQKGATGKLPFTEVASIGRAGVRVVFQGVEGAYSQAAMKRYFGERANAFSVETWGDALEAITDGMADFAVLPIENSTAGFVSEIYDLLMKYDQYIVGEQILRVEHRLLGLPGASLSDIRTVYSHRQGLLQCADYLDAHRAWRRVAVENTAGAAKKVADDADKSQAAIASPFAGEVFGLRALEEKVCANENNFTRFLIVCNQRIFETGADKISVCFEVAHRSGALFQMLSHFIYNNLNMTKIESRPVPGKNWEYRFFVDLEGNFNDTSVKNALRGLTEEALHVKILGNYRTAAEA